MKQENEKFWRNANYVMGWVTAIIGITMLSSVLISEAGLHYPFAIFVGSSVFCILVAIFSYKSKIHYWKSHSLNEKGGIQNG